MKTMHIGYDKKCSISIEEQKKIELEILEYVDRFCTENKISYCIAYGTLIGAIRHKGFIPWDDDIDIVMTRENYCRFIELFSLDRNEQYHIASELDNKNYPFSFIKIEDTRTVLFEKNMVESFNGIYIDVFPLDNVPEDDKKRLKYVKRILFWHNVMGVKIRKRMVRHSKIKTFASDILFLLLKIVSVSFIRKRIRKNIEAIQGVSKRFVGNLSINAYIKKEKYNIKHFEERCKVEFEGVQVDAPLNYDEVLRTIYGDYMQLPPEEKRIYRHGTTCYWKSNKAQLPE